jgi:hypothetical protein
MKFWLNHPPSRIWISSRRLPMMHRYGWTGKEADSNVAYSWYVWDASSDDRCKLGWFDWRDYSPARPKPAKVRVGIKIEAENRIAAA